MKRAAAFRLWLSLLACVVSASVCSAQAAAIKQDVLRQARQSYYNLRNEGLSSFQCSVTPNWELLLHKEMQENPEGAAKAIQLLNQLRFTVNLAANNKVNLTHNELTGQSDEMKAALQQIYGGMEQMASGFFDTWNLFLLIPPFPDASSDYHLETAGTQYKLFYKDGTADVITTMGRDFAISDFRVTTPEFNSSIQPHFTKTGKGLLLSAYEATYQSQKAEETTQLKVLMDYQVVDGFQMLKKLNLSGTYGGASFAIELGFSGCQVTKK